MNISRKTAQLDPNSLRVELGDGRAIDVARCPVCRIHREAFDAETSVEGVLMEAGIQTRGGPQGEIGSR